MSIPRFRSSLVIGLGALAVAGAAGATAVGAIMAGSISGTTGLAIEQSILIDRDNFTLDDIGIFSDDKVVTFNDEGTAFTVASEMQVGEELVLDVPLANVSGEDAAAIATLMVSPGLRKNIEVFWDTLSCSTSPSPTSASPSPSPITTPAPQPSDTVAAATAPTGAAGINAQVATTTDTTSSPGLPSSVPQHVPAPVGPTPPGASGAPGSVWFPATLSVDINADGTTETVSVVMVDSFPPDGSIDWIELDIDSGTFGSGPLGDGTTGPGNDELISAGFGPSTVADVALGAYLFEIEFIHAVGGGVATAFVSAKTHFEGSFDFDADANGELEGDGTNTVFFALSDLNSDGVYDAIDFSISEDDTTLPDLSAFGEGNLGDGSVVDGNDERITAAGATHVSGVYTGNATFKIGTEFSVELA